MALIDASERQGPVWQKIKQHYEKRLESFRKSLENPAHSAEETALRRGRIAEIRAFLALDRELPPHEPDNPPDGA